MLAAGRHALAERVNERRSPRRDATRRARLAGDAKNVRASVEAPISTHAFGGTRLIARSASAVIVKLGFTPTLALTADPSAT